MADRIIHGVNAEAIGRGVFEIMPEEERYPLVWGMIPYHWITMVEGMIKEELAERTVKHYENRGDHFTEEQRGKFKTMLSENIPSKQMKEIMKGVSVGILAAAKEAGVCRA